MKKRSSFVQKVVVNSIQNSGILEIGDSVQILGKSNVIAVQREWEIFFGNEGSFQAIPLFSERIPLPIFPIPPPKIHRIHESRHVHVGNIDIKGISASGIVQVGNTSDVKMESRVFHVRQLSERTFNKKKEKG